MKKIVIFQNYKNQEYDFYKNYSQIPSEDDEILVKERFEEINECIKHNIPVYYHSVIDCKDNTNITSNFSITDKSLNHVPEEITNRKSKAILEMADNQAKFFKEVA